MKRIFCIIMSVLFLAGMAGCKNDGGGLLPLLGLGGSSGESSDPATMKYLEYMYNNENGKRLNDQAMSGMPAGDDFKAELKEYMSVPFIESLGQSGENAGSANWWERLDINSEKVSAYLDTPEGQKAMDDYMGVDGGEKAGSISGSAVSGIKKSSVMLTPEAYKNTVQLLNDMSGILTKNNILGAIAWVFVQIQAINEKLDAIQLSIEEGFEQTLYQLDSIEEFIMNQPLVEARNTVNAKIKSFVNLDGYDNAYRRSVVKDYFTTEHQVLFEQAYDSALVITRELNSRPASDDYKKVPGNMLYSHMVFMRQMSELRLAYAPVFYSGMDLLRFRANWAKSDLVWLKEIKDAFLSDPDPDADIDYFNRVCALLVSWEIELRSHIELYNGLRVTDVDLENASNINDTYAFATFGDLNEIAGNGTCGEPLTSNTGAAIMSLFNYGDSLAGIFDAGRSGGLAAGRYLRVIHDGKNLLSDLGLVPVSKKLTGISEINAAPGKNQFFIDPALGRMVLPRPSYWSRMDSLGNLTDPELKEEQPVYTGVGSGADDVLFNKKCFLVYSAFSFAQTSFHYPFGKESTLNTGTISFWVKQDTNWNTDFNCVVHFGGSGNNVAVNGTGFVVNINGQPAATKNITLINDGKWHHVYVNWDLGKSLAAGTERIQVYVDGEKEIGLTDEWTPGVFYLTYYTGNSPYVFFSLRLDNMKIWKHVVAEDSEWEYNKGNGREGAYHFVYGKDAGYSPKITGSGNGVGYYYVQ